MKRVTTLFAASAAMLLLSVAAAWACTNLATLNLSEASVQAGDTIDVSGSAFASPEGGAQEVEIHWDGAEGVVLTSAAPDANGNITTTVTIPAEAQPGYHVLVATQNTVDAETGEVSAAYGTPARASVLIGTVPAGPAAAPDGTSVVQGSEVLTPQAASTGMVVLTVLLALAGIGLFAAGLGLFVREVRRREAPALAKDKRE